MSGEEPNPRPGAPSHPQQPFAWLRLAAAIRSNVERIAAAEQTATGQSPLATRHQCDLAVRFIAHYAEQDYRWRAPRSVVGGPEGGSSAAQLVTVDATVRRSLFEVFTSIAVHLQVGHRVRVRIDAARQYLGDTAFQSDCTTEFVQKQDAVPAGDITASTATQIVFDSSDASAAFAELAAAGADRTAPWRIRLCWIQESLRDRFESAFARVPGGDEDEDEDGDELDQMARTLGGRLHRSTTVRDALPLIVGVAPDQWPRRKEEVVLVQFFRTAREVLDQVARTRATSVSAWTENMSLAFEVAQRLPGVRNVWMNSVGLLNPKVPFTFADASDGGTSCLYGTELAQCQAAIYDGSAEAPGEDLERCLSSNFRKELANDDDDFSAWRTLNGITYLTTARRRTAAPRRIGSWVATGGESNADAHWRRRVANVVYARFQTMVVPMGTIVAN